MKYKRTLLVTQDEVNILHMALRHYYKHVVENHRDINPERGANYVRKIAAMVDVIKAVAFMASGPNAQVTERTVWASKQNKAYEAAVKKLEEDNGKNPSGT